MECGHAPCGQATKMLPPVSVRDVSRTSGFDNPREVPTDGLTTTDHEIVTICKEVMNIVTMPAIMKTSGTSLYATFTGYGLYEHNGTAWTRIHTAITD